MKTKIISGILLVGLSVGAGLVSARISPDRRAGYRRDGVYVGEDGKPLNKTLCSRPWTPIPGTNPQLYSCSGTVSGSGPLGGDTH